MEAFTFLQARKRRQVSQLVLLNNLARADQTISSTMLLTLFNRVLSSTYDDKIQVKFLPSQGILQEQLNSYNVLAQSDYLEMNKAQLDYDCMWDTLFFGRGYIETIRFNQKRKVMEPDVINPLVLGYDPYFEKIQDWRYYWKWITKNKWEIEKLITAGVITGIKKPSEIESGIDTYLWDYKIKVDQARKGTAPSPDTQMGDVYQILEFYGYNDQGNKCVYWADKGFSKILFEMELDLQDGEELVAPDGVTVNNGSRWPLVVKEAFREPHSSISFSIADLLEDKHRAKSVLLNLAYLAAKDRANPIYGYNPDKVRDVSQFFNRQISQHIPMDGPDAVWPLNTEDPMSTGLIQFIRVMENEAESPVGAGRPMGTIGSSAKASATELAIDQQLNDMALSLQSKVLQFGESDFWSHWFYRYKQHGKDFGSKMANIVGVKGVKSQEVSMEDFQTDFPPGVMIYSAKEAEYKEMMLRRDMISLYPQLQESLDADGMRNFNKYVFFPKLLQDPSLIETILPDTLDELHAQEENELLHQDKYPTVAPTDNHQQHIYTHQMVQPKTLATWFHIAEHQSYSAKQKAQQMLQQKSQNQPLQPDQTETTPADASVPLKQAMQSSTKTLHA